MAALARSMPDFVQNIMLAAPTPHFVEPGQAILYRGADCSVVGQPFLALTRIGALPFAFSLARFRKTPSQMACGLIRFPLPLFYKDG